MTLPPYEWPTRITGLLTRPIVAFVKAMSSAVVLRPYCAAMHSYPSACRGTINLLKQEPSAQSPWQNTILGFVGVDFIFALLRFTHFVFDRAEQQQISRINSRLFRGAVFCRILLLLLFFTQK